MSEGDTMNLYECRRGSKAWKGALLIYAENEEEAIKIYTDAEDSNVPYSIKKIDIKRGIIYNDYLR